MSALLLGTNNTRAWSGCAGPWLPANDGMWKGRAWTSWNVLPCLDPTSLQVSPGVWGNNRGSSVLRRSHPASCSLMVQVWGEPLLLLLLACSRGPVRCRHTCTAECCQAGKQTSVPSRVPPCGTPSTEAALHAQTCVQIPQPHPTPTKRQSHTHTHSPTQPSCHHSCQATRATPPMNGWPTQAARPPLSCATARPSSTGWASRATSSAWPSSTARCWALVGP